MEINSLVQTDNIDVLASVLTYLKQKKLNIIEEIRKKFDDMPNDFESNALVRESEGIDKAGNYALRKMKWLVSAKDYDDKNYYDLIATAKVKQSILRVRSLKLKAYIPQTRTLLMIQKLLKAKMKNIIQNVKNKKWIKVKIQ